MLFSKDFLDLNLQFARNVSRVAGQSFPEALLEYTHLYLAFGLGREFNRRNSIWQSYVDHLADQLDQSEYTYSFYLERKAIQSEQRRAYQFGCFSYVLWDGNRARLHFDNRTKKRGVLQKQNIPGRMAELKAMFKHLKEVVSDTSTVVGGSWLYNIEAYRRLFPI